MTALSYIIDRFYHHLDGCGCVDLAMDKTESECEYVGIDFDKVSRAAYGNTI
jgi:hypothetical protein